MLEVGKFAFDTVNSVNVQILERIEAWGYISYRVFNPASGHVYKSSEKQLKEDGGTNTYDENYLRYVTLLSKIKNETAGGLLSSLASGVIPLPHQLHVLNRAMKNNTIRYILADEVGLGKTIEAGMVIKELKTRGLIQRILVVCPTGLVTQWAAEMQEKFHEKFNVILPSDYDTIRRLTDNDDVYGQYDQVISPMDSIKPIEKHAGWTQEKVDQYNEERIYSIINSGWDLIIIDEAHRVAGSTGEVARYKLGYLLSQTSPYLLLLSATPHNGKTEPFLRLVRLLDAEAFPNAKSIVKEQVAPYLIRTEKREAIDNNGNKLFKNRITHLVTLNWDERHTMQRELYELVTDYVSKTYNKALRNRKKNMCLIFLLIIMQRMVTSSTAAILQSLERRLQVLKSQSTHLGNLTEEDLAELDIEDGVEDALEAMGVAYSAAKTLVRTETAYIYETSTMAGYSACGIEWYEFLATLDYKTSEICQEMDGKHFKVEDAVPGKNFPPMHPNCRSTTVCWFPEEESKKARTTRIAKNESGKYYEVQADMTYKEWRGQHKDKTQFLSYSEKRALSQYCSFESYQINEKLRKHLPLSEDEQRMVDKLNQALDKMDDYKGNVVRCVDIRDLTELKKFLQEHQKGKKVKYDAFTSASTEEGYNPDANILLYIKSRNGKDITSFNSKEKEVLYKKDQSFIIKELIEKDGVFYIVVWQIR